MKNILIVDDEESMRLLLRDLLEKDYNISLASNGKEALSSLARSSFDLIITDLLMPEMGGIELIIAFKNNVAGQKILAMSGGGRHSRYDYLPTVTLLGADKVFSKPFQLDKLKTAVNSMLS